MTEYIDTENGKFAITARIAGFDVNDGKLVVELMPKLHWGDLGALIEQTAGRFIGVFDTRADALLSIANAAPGAASGRYLN